MTTAARHDCVYSTVPTRLPTWLPTMYVDTLRLKSFTDSSLIPSPLQLKVAYVEMVAFNTFASRLLHTRLDVVDVQM